MTKEYYYNYDYLYKKVYRSGVKYWSEGPKSNREKHQRIKALIESTFDDLHKKTLIEFGCGEGNMALFLDGIVKQYTGIDCSSSAIKRAINRKVYESAQFHVMDILKLNQSFLEQQYDLVFDMACYHMLVLKTHRETYLNNAHKILKKDGGLLLTNQYIFDPAKDGDVYGFQNSEDKINNYSSYLRNKRVWDGNQYQDIQLPHVPSKPQSLSEYCAEVSHSGFSIVKMNIWGESRKYVDFILKLQ